jgi:acetolactate decarboxylase
MKKVLLLLLILGFTCACKQDATTFSIPVKTAGSLRAMMHQGNIEAHIGLDSLQKPSIYALGAAAQLKGEVLIWDGQLHWARALDSAAVAVEQNPAGAHASLLVYSSVSRWQSFSIPDSVLIPTQLEAYLPKMAHTAGLDTNEAFPFRIEGQAKVMSWHVINWPEGDTIHTHKKHVSSGAQGILYEEPVAILGFYSQKHQGVFTHHSRYTHMHFKSADEKLSGHVDKLLPSRAMTLYLPKP